MHNKFVVEGNSSELLQGMVGGWVVMVPTQCEIPIECISISSVLDGKRTQN